MLELADHRGVSLDGDVATVRSGTTWAEVQELANREGLAVRVQQSSNNFTAGGSLSVNCHGRDKDFGPIASTVRSLRVLLADGRILTATPEDPSDSEAGGLFAAVLGGYGLVGEWSGVAKAARWRTLQSRIDLPGSAELMSLNDAMRPPVAFLFARWGTTTVNILQESFVPASGFEAFVDQLRTQTYAHGVDLQNITTRWVAGGDRALLSDAPEPRIAVVLCVNLPLTDRGVATGQAWSRALVDASLAQGGSDYLAYQRWPTRAQLAQAYPGWAPFVEARDRFDPDGLFHGQFWAADGP